jgi:porin
MMKRPLFNPLSCTSLALTACFAAPASAQDKPVLQEGEKAAAMPSLIEKLPDYSGDLSKRSFLLGDWGGTRTELAEKGILFDIGLTQVFQGNAHGGRNTKDAAEYSGSFDLTLKFDTARMGLWPGGLLTLRGETWFGNNMHSHVGSIMAANADNLFPVPGDSGKTTLSEYYFAQALSEKFVLVFGKMDLSSTLDQNAFASSEKTQFMNLGLRANPVLLPYGPYTTLSFAAVYMPTKWLKISTGINDNDPDGAVTKTGFNTAFHGRDWYSIGQEFEFTIKPWEKEGHQRLGWAWTARDMRVLDADNRIQLPTLGTFALIGNGPLGRLSRLVGLGRLLGDPEAQSDDWVFYYNFDQYVFTEADDPKQGIGVFGRFGYSTGKANPIEQFYSLGISGKGILPERDNDTCGLGYYHVNLSDDLPELLGVHSEQGVELFYNIEVTPWFHLTPDLQVIVNPGGGFQDRDVAVVYGLRGQMSF